MLQAAAAPAAAAAAVASATRSIFQPSILQQPNRSSFHNLTLQAATFSKALHSTSCSKVN
jgi:hypothetical protein